MIERLGLFAGGNQRGNRRSCGERRRGRNCRIGLSLRVLWLICFDSIEPLRSLLVGERGDEVAANDHPAVSKLPWERVAQLGDEYWCRERHSLYLVRHVVVLDGHQISSAQTSWVVGLTLVICSLFPELYTTSPPLSQSKTNRREAVAPACGRRRGRTCRAGHVVEPVTLRRGKLSVNARRCRAGQRSLPVVARPCDVGPPVRLAGGLAANPGPSCLVASGAAWRVFSWQAP
jgi:hypothetical protein